MKISEKGIALIKQFEGCVLKAYKCPAGVWTIGYGDTTLNGNSVKQGDVITQSQAETMLTETLKGYEIGITKSLKKTINQNQFDALVVFSYNVGINAAKKSTLLKKVNAEGINNFV
jgi:lysozyme